VPLEEAVEDALAGGPAAAAAAAPYVAPPPPTHWADEAGAGAGAGGGGGGVTGPGFPGAAAAPPPIVVGRLHPGRLFYPGMTYSPNDLVAGEGAGGGGNASASESGSNQASTAAAGPTIPGFTGVTAATFAANPPVSGVPPRGELRAVATDFRNAPLLAGLLSATGKLPPRRRTRLAAKDHRTLCRTVKLARRLALIAPLGRDTVSGGPKEVVRRKRAWAREDGGEAAA